MGVKKILPAFYAFGSLTAGLAVTGSNTYIQAGTSTYIGNLDNLGLQVFWTGTPTGTISFLASNDSINFQAITVTVPSQPAGGASSTMITLPNQLPWLYLQIKYVNTSGTGAITAILAGKDVN